MNVIILSGQGPSNQFMSRYAGPHRLATELRDNGITTQIIMGLGYYSTDQIMELLERNVGDDTLVIGISTTFFVEYSQRYALTPSKLYRGDRLLVELPGLVEKIKTRWPNVKIVIGGPNSRKKLNTGEYVDLYIEGYADRILIDYVQSLKSGRPVFYQHHHNGKPIITNNVNENFNFRASTIEYHHADHIFTGEALPLEISRGCIFKCKFCSYPLRGKSIKDNSFIKDENIIYRELLRNYDQFGATNYIFVDDTFNDNQEKLRILHSIFQKLPFKINFAAYIRADLLAAYPESIELLGEMGIRGAFFGIESLNDRSRRAAAKGFNTEKLLKVIDTVNSRWSDVVITSSFIYGLPHDNIESMRDWTENIVLNSGLFDRHDAIFQPLFLQGNTSTLVSDFDLEMDKYGYRFTGDSNVWDNGSVTFRGMFNLAKEYNTIITKTRRPFSSFHAVTLLGYGLTTDEILNLDSNNPEHIEFVENLTIERYNRYYELCKK